MACCAFLFSREIAAIEILSPRRGSSRLPSRCSVREANEAKKTSDCYCIAKGMYVACAGAKATALRQDKGVTGQTTEARKQRNRRQDGEDWASRRHY